MWKKICCWVVGINYLFGVLVLCSIYFIGGWLKKLLGFGAGQLIVLILQGFLFYCAIEVEKIFKETTIKEHERKKPLKNYFDIGGN